MQARLIATRIPVALAFVCLVALMSVVTPATAGTLKVTSFPSGAQVMVDGVNTGKLTPMNISVADGDHIVTVQIPGSGWNPDTRTVTIVPGNNDLSVTLLPTPTPGPPGAKGDKGDQGIQGIQGIQGNPGSTTHPDPPCFDNVNRYVNCGNGTVTDTVTGLVWLKAANCLPDNNWAGANQAAADLKDGDCGLTDGSSAGDWRLPTTTEWSVMVARANELNCAVPVPIGFAPTVALLDDAGTACYAPGASSFPYTADTIFWSSTTSAASPSAAGAQRLTFTAQFFFQSKSLTRGVWPVRGGSR